MELSDTAGVDHYVQYATISSVLESRVLTDDGQLTFTAHFYGETSGVYRAHLIDDCRWDLTGDAIVGPADLAIILGNWGPVPPNDPIADPAAASLAHGETRRGQ